MKPFTHYLSDGKKIEMTPVGSWIDLAEYYQGDDNNYWSFNRTVNRWVNNGPKMRNLRGKTLDGQLLETLPELK